ncbi:MAG: OFA family MFS transporter [Candidatus Aminicenantes bacterium]|nr:OFA family MFS transporter [Candidatus Aminicenantes bacterium]
MKKGWIVVLAGLGINLALGVLYAWSMFSKQLTEAVENGGFGWSRTTATLPYTIAIAFFALMMVPAGRLQDKLGPRLTATIGAVLIGAGLIVAGFGRADLAWPILLGFGLMAGTGIGLGYAAATPAAVKWFGPEKKGMITGIVVAGFGLAPVYIAPLSKSLLASQGIGGAFRTLGFIFLAIAGLSAQFLVNPKPGQARASSSPNKSKKAKRPPLADATWKEMIRTPKFWSLYLQFACGATAGLMVIGHIAKIVSSQSGGAIQAGFLFVALMAVFNAGGRVAAGMVSDIIGRVATMIIVFIVQASVMFFFDQFTTAGGFLFGAALVGFNYGSCLSLFPATAADYWGTKNLGLNYGILFTAWGVGGVFGPSLAGMIADSTGSYAKAYQVSGALLLFASLLAVWSHMSLSFKLADKQLVITLGRRSAAGENEPEKHSGSEDPTARLNAS